MQDNSLPDRRKPRPPVAPKRGVPLHALGRAVRELRARRGLSQEELGFCSGLHRNYIGAIERGEINPTFRVMLKLSRGLAVPLSELVTMYEGHRDAFELYRPGTRPRPARTHDR